MSDSDPDTITAPRWGRLSDAAAESKLSKGSLYKLAKANPGLFKKLGAATIVDMVMLHQIISDLPAA
jgi:hypothetical protein